MARREEPAPSLPLLPFLASLLLAVAMAHGSEQGKPDLQPQHPLFDLPHSELSQRTGAEHSTKRHTEQTRSHSECQSSNPNPSQYDLSCKCPLCPVCSTAPTIPKYPEPHQCKKLIPPGYEYFKSLGYYRLHTVPVDWMTAKATCEREGAHLAIINSQDEANLMKILFSRDPDLGIGIFLGFHDLYKEGKYVTVLGAPLSQTGYFTWGKGQPDNFLNNEHCGSMYSNGGLNDESCTRKQAFVCELPV